MCSVGQFASAIEALQGLGGGGAGGAKKVLESMGTLFAADGGARVALVNIIDAMSAIAPTLAKLPKEAGPRLKNIVEVIQAMDGMTSTKVKTITETLTEVKSLINELGDEELKGTVQLANVLAKPGTQTLKLQTVTPRINCKFEININAEQFAEKLAATGKLTGTGDGTN